MDERGESSSSRQFFPNEVGNVPVTPAKGGQPDPGQIWKNWLRNPFDEVVCEEIPQRNSFGCWDGYFGLTTQTYKNTGGMCNLFSMDDVETWNSISCRDLLALADATIRNSSGGGDGCNAGGSQTQQYGRLNVLCDLNSPPQMVTEPLINTGLSLQFTPLTPDVSKRAEQKQALPDNDGSTIVEANQDSEKELTETNQNETPQQKPKRRKHRPKVVTEGKPKRARKPATPQPATPKPDGSSTGKRKYVRRKGVEKSTATPTAEETNGVIHSTPDQQAKRTCKRKINFDESEKQAEATADKTCKMTSEGVESYQKVDETKSSNPITPNKTELPQERSKRNYTKAKCKIDFLQETRDKRPPSHLPSPNESRCITSACLNKGDEAERSKEEISSEIDRIKLLHEQTSALCHDSLESFQSWCSTSACLNKGDSAPRSREDILREIDRIKLLYEQPSELCHDSLESFQSRCSTSAFLNKGDSAPRSKEDISREIDRIKLLYEQPSELCHDSLESFQSRRSTSVCLNKGDKAQRSMEGSSSEIDRIKLLHEQTSALCHDSLEAFLSTYTDNNCVSKQSMPLSTINKVKAPKTSKGGSSSEIDRIKLNEQTLALCQDSLEAFLSAYTDDNCVRKQSMQLSTINKDKAPETSKGGSSSEINRIKLLQEQTSALCHDSLEAFLSVYTDNNCVSKQSLQLSTINKGKAPKTSKDRYMHTHGQNSKNKGLMVRESVSSGGYQQQHTKKKTKKNSMVPSLYHGHAGYNPTLRFESMSEIDVLVYGLERLHISSNVVVPYMSGYHEKNALVVYQQDRSLVPYEGLFNPVKKRKQRPKVDLDDETNRVWMLLLENIDSKGVDGTDEDKVKWWEEERRVFRGRVDSFIARMHLVQGDRRFSRWKGSVLDSVVGVFLTQNVSDHLSSSAFMSLAARYPLKPNTSTEPLHEVESILTVKQPYQVDEPGDHGPMMLQEANSCEEKEVVNSNGYSRNCAINVDLNDNSDSATYKESVISHTEVDEIASSQNSVDTCCMHKSEDPKDMCKSTAGGYTSFVELLHMQGKIIQKNSENCASEESGISAESASQTMVQMVNTIISQESASSNCVAQQVLEMTNLLTETSKTSGNNNIVEASGETVQKIVDSHLNKNGSNQVIRVDSHLNKKGSMDEGCSKAKKEKTGKTKIRVDWDKLRAHAEIKPERERTSDTTDSMDYDAIRKADVNDVADAIKERGMNNRLAERIKDMLDRLVEDHGSIDLEWLRDVPPDKAKEYLLSFRGLGLKSVECIRLLTLHHLAFPVDTNVGRIAVRLGWVPLQPLPESLQLHLLELYPVQETIQKYLWPRLCKLDQRTLYELHYQMITFGKVFCTKTKPNCNACPLRGECRHFASAFASARLALPAPDQGIARLTQNRTGQNPIGMIDLPSDSEQPKQLSEVQNHNPVIEELATPGPIVEVPATPGSIVEAPSTPGPIVEVPATPGSIVKVRATETATTEPIVEVPASPEPEQVQQEVYDIEDWSADAEEIPMIKLNIEEFTQNLQTYMETHMELGECDMSKALVAITTEAASIPAPKLKNVNQLRTEHQVYELPDSHPLLEGLDTREPDDPCSYLLAIWTPGETADSIEPPEGQCSSQESGTLCNEETCFFCNSTREANSRTVRGTLLIPCRTAMRGSFPLNGTYFQVNEVFADHDSSLNPIDVPRAWLWNLPRRTVYFGTSIPTIFKGLTTEEIQFCFWRGFVCVRGFDQKTRAPRPLMARLHFPVSKLKKPKMADEKEKLTQ